MSEQLGEGRLTAEDADRLAADIRPAWDLDEGTLEEGAMGADEEALLAGSPAIVSSGEPTDPTPPPVHDTLIQGTPTLAVGDVAGAAQGGGPVSTSRTQQVPEPARKKTMLGLGDDGEESAPIPLERKLAPPAGAPEKGPGDTLESPKLDLPRSSKPTPSATPVAVSHATSSARAGEESIELPLTKTSGNTLWIGLGLAAVAAAAIGFFALSGDETKPPTGATPAPTTASPTPIAATAAATAAATPTAATPTAATPASTASPTPTPTATPVATATTKPAATPAAPAKPPTTAKPGGTPPPAKPTSTGKPGLMRDTPF